MSRAGGAIARALAEDLGSGDITTRAVVPEGALASATIVARQAGVLAGVAVAGEVFETVDARIAVPMRRADGDTVAPGDEVIALEGPAAGILSAERVALNFLARLSGVASLTARYVAAVEGTGVRILDTRKTTPGLRALEKAAVVAGGGVSHRSGLFDAVLVKENHARAAGGVGEAARRALRNAPAGVEVEVEVATLAELEEVLDAGVERVLLDNMEPALLREAVALGGGRASLEASGGVTLDTVRTVADTGVDFISVGALTHSAPALDVSLLFAAG